MEHSQIFIGASILLSLGLRGSIAVPGWGVTNERKNRVLTKQIQDFPGDKDKIKNIFLIISGNDIYSGKIENHNGKLHYHFRNPKPEVEGLAEMYFDFISYLRISFPNAIIDVLPPLPRSLEGEPCCQVFSGNARGERYMKKIKRKVQNIIPNVQVYYWYQILKFVKICKHTSDKQYINCLFSRYCAADSVHLSQDGIQFFRNLYTMYSTKKSNGC